MFNFNTDLADERYEICTKNHPKKNQLDGIENKTRIISDKVSVSAVKVTNKNGENLLKKKIRWICYI